MIRIKNIIACVISLNGLILHAQVGLNNPNPDPSAILDVKSSDKGILIPRLTTSERNAMAIGTPVPAHGLMIFDTDLNRIYFWSSTKWVAANVVTSDSTASNEVIRIARRVSVGSSYVSKQPDTDGLIVEGNTGLGTDLTGGNKLRVKGTTLLEGNTTVDGALTTTGTSSLKATNVVGNLNVTGNQIISGNQTVTGSINASDFQLTGSGKNGPIPSGGIILWSGSTASVPSGWALCNGNGGTPDLRGRFVVGVSSSYSPGNIGGSSSHGHLVGNAGGHNHSVSGITEGITSGVPSGANHPYPYTANDDHAGWTSSAYLQTHTGNVSEGQHSHGLNINTSSVGDHSHSLSNENHLPPYYALAYIMKL